GAGGRKGAHGFFLPPAPAVCLLSLRLSLEDSAEAVGVALGVGARAFAARGAARAFEDCVNAARVAVTGRSAGVGARELAVGSSAVRATLVALYLFVVLALLAALRRADALTVAGRLALLDGGLRVCLVRRVALFGLRVVCGRGARLVRLRLGVLRLCVGVRLLAINFSRR